MPGSSPSIVYAPLLQILCFPDPGTHSDGGGLPATEMHLGEALISGGDQHARNLRPNQIEEKKESKIRKFLGFICNPLSWVMEMVVIIVIALTNGDGKPPDWRDFDGIVFFLVINSTISFIEENNDAAVLMAGLAPNKVERARCSDSRASSASNQGTLSLLMHVFSRFDPLKIDLLTLTYESLLVTKNPTPRILETGSSHNRPARWVRSGCRYCHQCTYIFQQGSPPGRQDKPGRTLPEGAH